jgi:hypothetical protein
MKLQLIPSYSLHASALRFSGIGMAILQLSLAAALFFSAQSAAGTPQKLTSPDQTPEGLEKSDWASIHAAHEGWKHQFNPVEGGWQARNPGQQWNTRFDGRGFMTTPDGANWTWGMEFQSYGFGGNLTEITGTPEVRASGQRLGYQWNANVEEWFINDQRGLEHGFIVKERPQGAEAGAPLAFIMSATGSLKPSVSSDAQTVHFRDAAGAPVLNYSGLKVWDAEGTILPSRFERGADHTFRLLVEESTARYPITIDPIAQQAYLKPTADSLGYAGVGDQFGYSVAVNGDTVVVGAINEDSRTTGINSSPNESASNSGAAYVFVRNGTTWSQQAYLKASQVTAGDNFGWSVAVSGDTVVVGAINEDSNTTGINSTPNESASNSGAAYVFVRGGTTWSQQAYLKASNSFASFGLSVSISGETVVVGRSGRVFVFVRSGTTWSQQAELGTGDQFGYSVAVSGDTMVVGNPEEDSSTTGINSTPNLNATNAGAAYVYIRSGTTWSQQAYLKASQVNVGDRFGSSVAVSGETVVVGAPNEDSSTTGINSTPNESASGAGAAYVFVRSGTTWSQQAYLKANQVKTGDEFGLSVASSGNTIVVGARVGGPGSAGSAYVFLRSVTTWSQQAYLQANQASVLDFFGISVAVSGDTVVVGANQEDSSIAGINGTPNEIAPNSGASFIFFRSGTSWSLQAFVKPSANSLGYAGVGDGFGYSVALSGNTVVVGAPYEGSTTTGVDSTPNESSNDNGAAYVFVRSGTSWSQQAYLKPGHNVSFEQHFGWSVAVSGDTVVVGAPRETSSTTGINSTPNVASNDAGAAYIFTRSGTTWNQQAYLKAGHVSGGDRFGWSVAVSGDTAVVGVPDEGGYNSGINSTYTGDGSNFNSGAAYVFVRSDTFWSQQAYIKTSSARSNTRFGWSVAVSGDTAVIGAYLDDTRVSPSTIGSDYGAAYVFVRSGVTWSQQAYLGASQFSVTDYFGYSVAVSGDTVVVGAPNEDSTTTGINSTGNESASNAGAAYVFVRSGTTWSQQAYLKASQVTAGDNFGWSVAVSGDTVAVGAINEDSITTGINSPPDESASNSGAAYVFVRSGSTWSQQSYLKAAQVTGSDAFGFSVAVSEDTVVVGAYLEDSSTTGVNGSPNENALNSGAAYIFTGFGPVVDIPSLAAASASSLTTSAATLNGTVLSDAGMAITSRGFVYAPTALNTDPVLGGDGVVSVTSPGTIGAFSVPLIDLPSGTAYSFKAYATNSIGTAYSALATFTTVASPPVTIADANLEAAIRTALAKPTGPITEADMLTLTRLNLAGLGLTNISGLEKATNLRILDLRRNSFANAGALWAVLDQITPMYCLYIDVRRPGVDPVGLLTQTVTDTSGGIFYITVDAPNLPTLDISGLGIDTSNQANLAALQVFSAAGVAVETGGINLPPVANATASILNAVTRSVNLNGSASSDIDGTIATWAWAWSGGSATGANPTVTLPVGETTVTLTITDNDGATSSTMVTVSFVPSLAAASASEISGSTATLNGNVLFDGGAAITGRGFVYAPTSVNTDPVLGGAGVINVTSPGTIGAFSMPLSDLPSGTDYTFKAYATNSTGSAYSTVATFTTLALSNPNLEDLILSEGTLSPSFANEILSYESVAASSATSILVTPVTADASATVTVNGQAASMPVSLASGSNTITILVTDQYGITTKTYTLVVIRQTTFADWAASRVASDALGDPDQDGISNLLEYAFGLNPQISSSSANLPHAGTRDIAGDTYLTLSYTRPKSAGGLGYIVEFSNDPAMTAASTAGEYDTRDNGNGTETITVRDFVSGNHANPARFGRVRVVTQD